ncbi:MAG: ABC transporter permease [Gemmatales bacterium]|nr:ABC transporter permease [Gemmatales bacterium]MDW8386343.1 ABC transporter permease [Gemmatales bacterium]
MIWVAIQMLTGDRAKFFGIVFGIAFASLLISQQSSIFCGLMLMTTSQIKDIQGADIWVMNPNVRFVDDLKPLSENDLYRVRGVPGVQWAVRLYKNLSRARLENGNFQQIILLGLDDATFVGAPAEITMGSLADLRRPDAIFIDEAGYHQLWPGEPFQLGRTFEMNDRRAVIVGICKASRTFQTFPVVYTRYSQAVQFAPPERKVLSFVLAQPEPGLSPEEVAARITAQTGLKALSRNDFSWLTIHYYLQNTGIPMNFGITVILGFLVGSAIAGQTFYTFTIENLKQFGALKAMGVSNLGVVGMVLLQALVVSVLGYGIGVGLAAAFGQFTRNQSKLAFFMPWEVLGLTALAVLVIALLSSVLSVRRVLVLEPGIVFR